MTCEIPTEKIALRADARAVNADAVTALVDSIGAVGLINPIRVRVDGQGYELIAGAHRLAACKRLGMLAITSLVVTDDDLHAELAMIDENLMRAELSASERASQTARRKAIYLELHPETSREATLKKGDVAPSRQLGETGNSERFTASTAKVTGQSERAVQRDAERGEKVIAEVLEMIAGTKLDTGSYLDKIKNLPPNEQVVAAKRDLAISRSSDRPKSKPAPRSTIDAGVKSRAAKEVAAIIAEHVPDEWWDAVKANLYAAGAYNIADALSNVTSPQPSPTPGA